MDIREARERFEREGKIYESALLTFHGVDGFDVYNCSIPFEKDGKTYIYGRVERRQEWARSWVKLFEKVGPDEYSLVQGSAYYQLEDPYVQWIHGELILGGTHVQKTNNGQIGDYFGYFYRGNDLEDMLFFTTGPRKMKDIRLVPLKDGSIGIFSRLNGPEIVKKYGSGAVIGFAKVNDLSQINADLIENAPAIGNLFGQGEWGGCNQCYLLKDGRVGVIGHKSYKQMNHEGVNLSVYLNVAFIFDPDTHQATEPQIIATRKSYPDAPAKLKYLSDCAFTSGIVLRPDGKADLYSGIGDAGEGRVTIDHPFPGLL